jgi:DNA transformation protein
MARSRVQGFTVQGFRSRAMNAKDESFKDFVLDQLQDLDAVEARRMFGGYGLYQDETFFGIIHKSRLYFKIDESTVAAYRKRKMKPFRPNAKQALNSYHQVPVDVIENADELLAWALKAVSCQITKK